MCRLIPPPPPPTCVCHRPHTLSGVRERECVCVRACVCARAHSSAHYQGSREGRGQWASSWSRSHAPLHSMFCPALVRSARRAACVPAAFRSSSHWHDHRLLLLLLRLKLKLKLLLTVCVCGRSCWHREHQGATRPLFFNNTRDLLKAGAIGFCVCLFFFSFFIPRRKIPKLFFFFSSSFFF